ncbi:MAG: T9SS type A sorting domain-containing protein [Ignavibacteriaceae bacterium]
MRLRVHVLLITLFLCTTILAQDAITFDDQGWSSNQSLESYFIIGNYLYSGNKTYYTNYGCNFDVYGVSLYSVFQNPAEDQFTITSLDNHLFNLNSIAAYQVSELSTDNLIIEGWNGSIIEYTTTFSNITNWQVLDLNYYNVNRVVIKLDPAGSGGLTDFNFDDFVFGVITVSEDSTSLNPKNYNLSQNYPNPFNPSTVINYQIPQSGKVIIKIYDLIGNEVSTLVDEYKEAGSYNTTFEAGSLTSGMYIYKLITNGFVSSKKMMLVK